MVTLLLLALLAVVNQATTGSNPLNDAETLELKKKVLDYHNWQRHFSALGLVPGPDGSNTVHPQATNMVNLVWDDELAAIAQSHSETCQYEHNSLRSDQVYAARGKFTKFKCDLLTKSTGENIGYGTVGGSDASTVVMNGMKGMMTESEYYDFTADTCSNDPCKHYTQMTWATSRVLGCGWSLCPTLQTSCDDGTCSSSQTNAVFYVCNYWPLGNRYYTDTTGNKAFVGLWDVGEPCSDCPWDHNECTYNATTTLPTYDSDWNNLPSSIEEYSDGLCIGCGNEYYEICSIGLNNGLGDNCNSNIESVGCKYNYNGNVNSKGIYNGQQVCDKDDDKEYGIPDADTCTLSDKCRYQCGSCYCGTTTAIAAFKACYTECTDGLNRTIEGGCAGDSYFETYLAALGGCNNGPGGIGGGSKGQYQANISIILCIISIIVAIISIV